MVKVVGEVVLTTIAVHDSFSNSSIVKPVSSGESSETSESVSSGTSNPASFGTSSSVCTSLGSSLVGTSYRRELVRSMTCQASDVHQGKVDAQTNLHLTTLHIYTHTQTRIGNLKTMPSYCQLDSLRYRYLYNAAILRFDSLTALPVRVTSQKILTRVPKYHPSFFQ